jgi:hypothetical protein
LAGPFSGYQRVIFISHRGHRGLIWIAERAIQIKVASCYRRSFVWNSISSHLAKEPLGLLINFNEVMLKDGITRIINATLAEG